jgi:hypothetical protein
MDDIQHLAARIRALSDKMGIEPSTLSRKLFGGGARLSELEAGSSMTLATFARVEQLLSDMERAAAQDAAA